MWHPMHNLQELIPTGKSDEDRARAAVAAGYPAVEPILPALMEWIQDSNWPVATILLPLLTSVGPPLVPHIWHVLRSGDLVWKYWVIGLLVPSLPETVASTFREELERLSYNPELNERIEELDQRARSVLMHFGWRSTTMPSPEANRP